MNEGFVTPLLKSTFSGVMIFMLLMTFASVSAQSQTKQSYVLQGTVISAVDNKPLQGVSVDVEAEKLKTSTNNDGSFSITVSQCNGKVKLIFAGYTIQELEYIIEVVLSVQLSANETSLTRWRSYLLVSKNTKRTYTN